MRREHIVVGLSGGVDSSVAAALLTARGHRVTGLFMKNWEEDDDEKYCAAAEDLNDAEAVCRQLGIPFRAVNFSYEYWERVFRLFVAEYKNGRTPNPDVLCNKEIKFKEFLHWALRLGADRIATGHYARRATREARYALCKARDMDKDQSYFLHALDQNALRYARFPLGDMRKKQVRRRARELGLPNHAKKDSTGICFIGARRFRDFLARYLPPQTGAIKTVDGVTVGEHRGAWYYTIGQRRGLEIGGAGEPWYVARKDVARNIIFVAQGRAHPALQSRALIVENLHWIAAAPAANFVCAAKIRYRQADQDCAVQLLGAGRARVEFARPQWAAAAGQAAVFYRGAECLGGGIIQAADAAAIC